MTDYRGNFYSSEAYIPSYNVDRLTGLVKQHVVTAAEVTATKAVLYDGNAGYTQTIGFIGVVSRAGVMLPTNYTLERAIAGNTGTISLKGNGNYTLTAGDVLTYIMLPSEW